MSHNTSFSEISHESEDHFKDRLTGAVMARDQLVWLIKKDDLILSDKSKKETFTFEVNFPKNGPKMRDLLVYTYDGPRETLPDRLSNAENGASFDPSLLSLYTSNVNRTKCLPYHRV